MTSMWFVAYSGPRPPHHHSGETAHGRRERPPRPRRRGPEPQRPRPRDPRLRTAVVEVRRRHGDRGPGEVRHVVDAVLPGAQRPHRPSGGARGRPAAGPPPAPAARRPPAPALGPPP